MDKTLYINSIILITRAHSFPRQNLTNSAAYLVNSADHRGKADEIPRLTADTQLNFRGLIKSRINRSNTCYELMNPSFTHSLIIIFIIQPSPSNKKPHKQTCNRATSRSFSVKK